jgi:23S rRNA (uracil1939-C5)-methyltransferase
MKLRIEKAIYGGAGLARIGEGELAGKTVFAPLTLPGELGRGAHHRRQAQLHQR